MKQPLNPAPTGPHGLPLVGNYFSYAPDALAFMEATWREHGDLSRFPLGPFDCWLVVDPELVQQVMLTDHKRYHKGPEYIELESAVGKGLLTSEDQLWRRNRKLVQPAFHRKALARHAEVMRAEAQDFVHGLEPGAQPFLPALSELTLRIVSRALFSSDIGEEASMVTEAMPRILEHLNSRIVSPIKVPESWPTPGNRRFRADMRAIDAAIAAFVRRCREEGDRGDLLSALLFSKDPDTGEVLDDQQLRDEVVTLFAAGHETTATALCWTLCLLQENPDWDERLAAEAREVLDDGAGGLRAPRAEDPLPLHDRVIRESLRLRPPAWAMGRKPVGEVELDGHIVPEGALVFLMPWLTHRHPDHWEQPERFDPDRWLPERSEGRHRFAWYPFGGGPRVCIGQGFAMVEIKIVLASLLARFRVEVTEQPRPKPSITLRPEGELPVILHTR